MGVAVETMGSQVIPSQDGFTFEPIASHCCHCTLAGRFAHLEAPPPPSSHPNPTLISPTKVGPSERRGSCG
jgi:hypothetical protein